MAVNVSKVVASLYTPETLVIQPWMSAMQPKKYLCWAWNVFIELWHTPLLQNQMSSYFRTPLCFTLYSSVGQEQLFWHRLCESYWRPALQAGSQLLSAILAKNHQPLSVSEGLPASPWHECPQQGLGRPWRQQPVCRTSPQPSLSELCITAWHNKFKSININYGKPNGMGTNTPHESGAERTTDTSQFVPVALFSCKLLIIRHTVAYNIQNRATETRNSSVFFHYETIFTLGCFFYYYYLFTCLF